jgi:hypothetical protein
MSKVQRSNKEAKKPKKGIAAKPLSQGSATPVVPIVVPDRMKKK